MTDRQEPTAAALEAANALTYGFVSAMISRDKLALALDAFQPRHAPVDGLAGELRQAIRAFREYGGHINNCTRLWPTCDCGFSEMSDKIGAYQLELTAQTPSAPMEEKL